MHKPFTDPIQKAIDELGIKNKKRFILVIHYMTCKVRKLVG
ncbi:hypothetical protein [Enterococcus faecium]